MAEARSAVSQPRVGRIEEGRSPKVDFLLGLRGYVIRRYFRIRNSIKNGMWPTKLWNLEVFVAVLSVVMVGDWAPLKPVTERLRFLERAMFIPSDWPVMLRSLITSVVAGFIFFIIFLHLRRYMLRMLLAYRGWMYEMQRSQSVATLIWGVLVKIVSGSHPSLYGCQQSLPRLPVPPLKKTLKDLIQSLKPVYGEDSQIIQDLKKESKEFQRTLGPKLQRILYLKSWWSQNYVTDFWEKYVYLMGRSPLPINSNYYILDQSFGKPTTSQVARVANSIYQVMMVRQNIEHEKLEPLLIRDTIPICMGQYEKLFSTTRVPGEEIDQLDHYSSSESKHIIVNRKGILYKLDVFDKNRKLVTPANLQKQIHWIMADADKHLDEYSEEARSLPALTGLDRTKWARIRGEHFSQGLNKETLEVVEKAVFHVYLGTEINEDFSSRAMYLFVADGKSIWFDKSLTLVSQPDGRLGVNCEHSIGDAPVMAHVIEFNFTQEACGGILCPPISIDDSDLEQLHDSKNSLTCSLYRPERLLWEIPTSLANSINSAHTTVLQAIEDLDHRVEGYFKYGKGFVKTCKVSPDAYIQMALQLTYYKNAGKHCLTYESSMTRLYLMGRTETVRSLTMEASKFVKAFFDKSVSREEKISLLRAACEKHAVMYKDCMNGKGIDRHLFALYVVSKGLDYDCEFLKKCLSIPWTLSTSQSPQQQLKDSPSCDMPEYRDKVSPGGGFGPVSDDGYGVAYMIPGDFKFFFHVSSKKSSKQTDSTLFMKQLFETLDEMKQLFEGN
ncbi:carnitine O-palmitoyltransferase 1, liver isoform-like isoform X1 [Mya arenaria]|uniref:carnitine O-palmitoyltransferase 1, liver isoform-like isoform X1 n=1 Tax=Mya arenaria TaxID=6604 RepID=UPI0022E28156|nr:carnitine O-palmitoyltransferase 1, liver isoform-like isoform X1 [Mya arenaria]